VTDTEFENQYTLNGYGTNDSAPEDSIIKIECTTTAQVYNDKFEDFDEVIAAKSIFYLFDSLTDTGQHHWPYLLDCPLETNIFLSILDSNGQLLSKDIMDKLKDVSPPVYTNELHQLCVLDRIEVLPGFRGQGIPQAVIKDVLRIFCVRCQLLAVHSCPLQIVANDPEYTPPPHRIEWLAQMQYQQFSNDNDASSKKLFDHYQNLGFTPVNDDILLMSNPYYF